MIVTYLMKNFIHYAGWELAFFDEAKNFRKYQIDILKKHIKGIVGEIGPGNGSLCEKYLNFTNRIFLFEPSRNLYKNLNLKFKDLDKVTVINDEFKPSSQKFDCILLMDVIEHIDNPSELLIRAKNSLNQNGKILINVPAFQHLYSNFDRDVGHVKRYDKKTFLNTVKEIPKHKINLFYYDSVGYFMSLFSKLLFDLFARYSKNYQHNFKQKIALWDFFIPLSKLLDKIFLNNFGKSLFIIIKK